MLPALPRIRDYAEALIRATTLDGKLAAPPAPVELEDPLPPLVLTSPGRPPELAIAPGRSVRVPPVAGMRDPEQRARILHALANHELQAIELFAWALLAFPDAPAPFRTGLLAILREEQRHCGLYLERLRAHGVAFGSQPVTGHFWGKLDQLGTPLAFVCAMGLTFENANLDFCQDYATAARAAGDHATAAVLDQVHDDELGHVRFAVTWLGKLAPGRPALEVYLETVRFPLGLARARGKDFDADARRRAGLDEDFIAQLAAVAPTRPGGGPR
ncbi:MAG: ferritin-like domain-containing protein [Deltaproteobacteria bacterium]|nr:ferritin-like domain-containing protein [Deltaproteobacteria bacterium]